MTLKTERIGLLETGRGSPKTLSGIGYGPVVDRPE